MFFRSGIRRMGGKKKAFICGCRGSEIILFLRYFWAPWAPPPPPTVAQALVPVIMAVSGKTGLQAGNDVGAVYKLVREWFESGGSSIGFAQALASPAQPAAQRGAARRSPRRPVRRDRSRSPGPSPRRRSRSPSPRRSPRRHRGSDRHRAEHAEHDSAHGGRDRRGGRGRSRSRDRAWGGRSRSPRAIQPAQPAHGGQHTIGGAAAPHHGAAFHAPPPQPLNQPQFWPGGPAMVHQQQQVHLGMQQQQQQQQPGMGMPNPNLTPCFPLRF